MFTSSLGLHYNHLQEDSRKALITAHYFIADHVINTLWLVIFSVDWWVYNPHDGSHPPFSPAQQGIADVGPGHGPHMTDEQRYAAAQSIWQREKGTSAAVLAVGWLIKVIAFSICARTPQTNISCPKWYFAAVLYSYAFHLQRGTYRSLPLTITASQRGGEDYVPLFENELGDTNDDGEGRLPAQSSRDIDFDADFDDLDGEDLERGRVRGRGPGSIGGYGEMASATRPKAKATAPPAVTSGRPHRVSYNKPPSASVSQRLGSNQTSPDKGKSRAIQRELERNGEVQKWDDEDDEDVSTSKTSEPSASESRPSIRSPPR